MREVSVFKAVSVSSTGGQMTYNSAFVWSPAGRLRYYVGKWTRATLPMAEIGYHPTVFIEEGAAKSFVEQSAPIQLLLFRATGRGKIAELQPRGYVYFGPNYVQPYTGSSALWPYGTAMFKEVRLDSFYGQVIYNPFTRPEWSYTLPNGVKQG